MVAINHLATLALAAAASAIPMDSRLEARQSFSIPSIGGQTANDVQSGTCKDVTYIFARGTTEQGNMGSTVGPALKTKLEAAIGADKLATQGVNYPADVAGTVVGSMSPGQAEGSKNCAQLVKQALSNCPQTKIVLAGYSQGAQQVHGCLIDLSADEAQKVAAAVTFGDPLRAQQFKNIDQSRTKIFCATGDLVCTNQFIITAAHLSYASESTGPAAEFIQQQLGTLDSSSSSSNSSSATTASTSADSSSTGSSDNSVASSGLGSGLLGGGLSGLTGGSSSGGSSLLSGLSGLSGSDSSSSGGSSLLSGLSGSSGSSDSGSSMLGGLSGLSGLSGLGGSSSGGSGLMSDLSDLSDLSGLGGSKKN